MDLSGGQTAGTIRAVRGMFPDGLHLLLQPAGANGPAITARLEEGRRYLDSDPGVLFSRYGLAEQEWTLVGIVGHQAAKAEPMQETVAESAGETFSRTGMIGIVQGLLAQMGLAGLIDMPQTPRGGGGTAGGVPDCRCTDVLSLMQVQSASAPQSHMHTTRRYPRAQPGESSGEDYTPIFQRSTTQRTILQV